MKDSYLLDELRVNSSIQWKVNVRISHIWRSPVYENPQDYYSKDMILIDLKGNRIHANVPKRWMNTFDNISEGSTYMLTNFMVSKFLTKIRYSQLPYKIVLSNNSVFKAIMKPEIPMNAFEFVDYDTIHQMNVNTNKHLVDIIGHLSAIGPIDSQYQRRNIYLRSSNNQMMKCTLWESYAHQFDSFGTDFHVNQGIVLIVHLANVKEFGGEKYISNTKGATRIIIDDSRVSEIKDFKKRFPMSEEVVSSIVIPTESNTPIYSVSEIFLTQFPRKTLQEILSMQEKCTCVTMATIEDFDDIFGWFYNSCKTCKSKVEVDGSKYYCKKCDATITFVVPRYKLHLKVFDNTSNAIFIMFEKQVMQLVKKTVASIQDNINVDCDTHSIPVELKELLNKTLLFKISITEYNIGQSSNPAAGFTVTQICEDYDVMNEYKILQDLNQDIDGPVVNAIHRDSEIIEISSITPSKRGHSYEDDSPTSNVSNLNETPIRRKLSMDVGVINLHDSFNNEANEIDHQVVVKQEK